MSSHSTPQGNGPAFPKSRLEEAEALLTLSEDELLKRIAEGDQEHAFPMDMLRWGRDRYEAAKDRYRESVCNNPAVVAIWKSEKGARRAAVVCAIADAITQVPAMTIATLIAKEGLDTYCERVWKA